MSFIQENIIELNLNLKKKYKLIHISDVHALTYNEDDLQDVKDEALKAEDLWYRQRTWFARKANEYYDDNHMIPARQCLINLIDYINKEKPDAAILTGDIIDYYSKANYELLINQIKRIEVPFVFSCGNHETPASKYKEITKSEDGFNVLDLKEFKIVSLDNSEKKVSIETLNILKEQLKENKKIIISMHIPISTKYNQQEMAKYDPYFVIYENETDDVTKQFIELLVKNDDIKTILCGHVHGHSQTYFAPNKMQCCASSGLIGLVNKIDVK